MATTYRRKNTVEAMQNDGTADTAAAIAAWIGSASVGTDANGKATVIVTGASRPMASITDWVLKMGTAGATYTDAVFQSMYEAAT